MTKLFVLSIVYTSHIKKKNKIDTTLKVFTENALANKWEKKNNCKTFAITGLF